jgi:hypothetical protein
LVFSRESNGIPELVFRNINCCLHAQVN